MPCTELNLENVAGAQRGNRENGWFYRHLWATTSMELSVGKGRIMAPRYGETMRLGGCTYTIEPDCLDWYAETRFFLISSSKADIPKEEEEHRFCQLRSALRDAGLRFSEWLGVWLDSEGEEKRYERVLVVAYRPQYSIENLLKKVLFEKMTEIARSFEQDAFIYYDGEFIYASWLDKPELDWWGRFEKATISQAYSKISKLRGPYKKFQFKGYRVPENMIFAMVMESAGYNLQTGWFIKGTKKGFRLVLEEESKEESQENKQEDKEEKK